VYYEIGGPYSQLATKAAFSGFFGKFTYVISYDLVGKAKYDDEKKLCSSGGWFSCTACYEYRSTRKQSVKFVLKNVEIHLPKWTDYNTGSQEEKQAWDSFISGLTTHEEGHRTIAEKQEGEQYFEGTGDWGDASWWARQDADEKWLDKVIAELESRKTKDKQLQQQYETDTNHGATQGAVLPQL
jgi:hypothetical protein